MLGCRFFSEGGNFAPEEVKMLQRRLTEEIKLLSVSEENIYREQEQFQFTSFQQVSTGTLDGEKQSFVFFCLKSSSPLPDRRGSVLYGVYNGLRA